MILQVTGCILFDYKNYFKTKQTKRKRIFCAQCEKKGVYTTNWDISKQLHLSKETGEKMKEKQYSFFEIRNSKCYKKITQNYLTF